jgi:Protein of unknown function (DUF3305)
VNVAVALARIPVGVVVERRKASNPWIDVAWRPVGVLAGAPAALPWTMLESSDDRASFYAGLAEIALYRTETGYYRDNLNSGRPSLWVSLRPTGVEPPFEIVAVSADPAEGESFTQVGDDLVEAVPMPPAVQAIVAAFVAEHHVERQFVKRKRDRADPQALAHRAPIEKDRRR